MTASGTLGLYPKFYGHDLDGNPLEGGKLYSFLSGTSTPLALYADAELTTALPNPLILDASGEALYYYGPATYALRLTDASDVPLWVIDPVTGTGGSGLAGAGIGSGQMTVVVSAEAGAAQLSAAVFPPGVLALGVTVWVQTAFGTAQGLAQVGVGTAALPDCWGQLESLDASTTGGLFQAYGGHPHPDTGVVTLTAYGGLFDDTGVAYVTGHYVTLTPSQTAGTSYTPPGGGSLLPLPLATPDSPGLIELATSAEVTAGTDATRAVTPATLAGRLSTLAPPASETVAGLVELATSAETQSGTDPTRAVTPAGLTAVTGPLQTQLDTLALKVPTGTALRVPRYASGGVNLESTALSVDASSNLRLGAAVAGTSLSTGLVLSSGVAPSAVHPADAVQLWVADLEGAAGQAVLHIRHENGVLTRPGTGLTRRTALFLATQTTALPYSAVADESGKVFLSNNSSGMVQVTLPAAVSGLEFEFLVNLIQGLRIRAAGVNVIRLGGTVGAAGAAIEATAIGTTIRLLAITVNMWQTMSPTTGWTAVA